MNVIMVGFNSTLLESISKTSRDLKITIIEEEELYNKKKLYQKEFPVIKEIIFSRYQQTEEYLDLIPMLLKGNYKAVLPGLEYAVLAANKIAKNLGLPFSGNKAIGAITDKISLRNHCNIHSIPQPKYSKVQSLEGLRDFYKKVETPIVLKPSGRQASLGVIKIDNESELEKAWEEVQNLDEGTQIVDRKMLYDYLVEECMFGMEVSSEVFIKDGKVLFTNITEKVTTTGKYSVELAHVVPGRLSDRMQKEVNRYLMKLIETLDFRNGVLHAELMITEQGPKIIEVAGRAPGDNIFKMIEKSYGFNPYVSYIEVLCSELDEIKIPSEGLWGTCIQFLSFRPGYVNDIKVDKELIQTNTVDYKLNVKPGDYVREIKSSWDRSGYVFTYGENANEAFNIAENLRKSITCT